MSVNKPSSLADFVSGALLLVNKPKNWTSFDVVNKLRYALTRKVGKIKVGHAGTLDPLATGLLIICTGKMTKELDSFQAEAKEYIGTFKIGAVTATYDAETEELDVKDISAISESDIIGAAKLFEGQIEQFPPVYSAIKINGKKAYDMARSNQKVEMPSRSVAISLFEITAVNLPEVAFKIQCSKGTYIRSLAHDLGQKIGVGAYLTSLVRTKSGDHKLADAFELNDLLSYIENMEQ
jgi:tRNA pseudouridine55 synthase